MVSEMKKRNILIILFMLILFIGINVEAKSPVQLLVNTTEACSGYFGDAEQDGTLMNLLVYSVFRPLQFLVPIILLVFTTLDFSKVVFTDNKDGMAKAKKNFVKRALIAVVIFFIPTILTILFEFVDSEAIKSCLGNF